jgi:hypothetical protein
MTFKLRVSCIQRVQPHLGEPDVALARVARLFAPVALGYARLREVDEARLGVAVQVAFQRKGF